MSRDVFRFAADDISALARALRGQLAALDHSPSHLEMLNMLARAGGHRNFQHFRAAAQTAAPAAFVPDPAAPTALVPDPALWAASSLIPAGEAVDLKRVERVVRLFDGAGRLTRWPGKDSWRALCLWTLWSTLPARITFAEREINARLNAGHLFADHALLRREMADRGLLWRTADGRAYRRIEQRPPAEAQAVIQRVRPLRHPPRPGAPGPLRSSSHRGNGPQS